MILGLLAIGIIIGLCVSAAWQSAEMRRANGLRDRLRAFESKR
jgi:hypothetical protein